MIEYSTRSWLRLLFRLRGTIVRRVAGRTLACAVLTWGVLALRAYGVADLAIPVVVHSVVGVALGLLLVFRTNASYDRYWEGRRAIGTLVSRCRDLARQSAAYLAKDDARRQLAARYIVGFYACVRRALREETRLDELHELIGEERTAELERAPEPPLQIAAWLTELYVAAADAGVMTETRLRNLDTNVSVLLTSWTDTERIHETPVPFAYAHHIKLFLTLFCFTLPFALADAASWYAIGGAAVVAFGMFGIDEIGVEIEDPFGQDENDLPLDELGARLSTEVTSVMRVP